jgi:hypothetical protein
MSRNASGRPQPLLLQQIFIFLISTTFHIPQAYASSAALVQGCRCLGRAQLDTTNSGYLCEPCSWKTKNKAGSADGSRAPRFAPNQREPGQSNQTHAHERLSFNPPTPQVQQSTTLRLGGFGLLLLFNLEKKGTVDVWEDTTEGDSGADQGVQLFIAADGKLEVARGDALDL